MRLSIPLLRSSTGLLVVQEVSAEDMEQSVARDMEERERKLTRNMGKMEEQHGMMLKDLHTEIDKMKTMNKGETLVSLI